MFAPPDCMKGTGSGLAGGGGTESSQSLLANAYVLERCHERVAIISQARKVGVKDAVAVPTHARPSPVGIGKETRNMSG